MKKAALLTMVVLLVFGFGGSLSAYEGGTKFVATMTQPEKGPSDFGPVLAVAGREMTPGKLVVQYLYRAPEPALSIERLREEKPGRSLGTKPVVLFQTGKRI